MPRKQGFDEYYGILYSNDMRPVQIVHNEAVAKYPVIQAELTRDYTQKALDFIGRNRESPFFLYLPHAMPHKPLAASEEFYTPDTPGDLYADVIRELDWSVGQILNDVRDSGLDRDTLVVFLSDNGPWFGGFYRAVARPYPRGAREPRNLRFHRFVPDHLFARRSACTRGPHDRWQGHLSAAFLGCGPISA
jgi:uncharacterized sulfatase